MLKVIIAMFSGIGVGMLFRRRPIKSVSRLVVILIWALLFLLGSEVGSDPDIFRNLQEMGIEALVLTVSGLAGSMAMSWALWRRVSRKGRG